MSELLLLLESSGSTCSVALYDRKEDCLSLRESIIPFNHAVEMGVFVDELLQENNVATSDLLAVAVSAGPGSYTGLRIGASLAKGICYGAKRPLIAISSLKSLAALVKRDYEADILTIDDPDNTIIVSLTDARRMEVYRAAYNFNLECISEPEAHVLSDDSFSEYMSLGKKIVFVGDGAVKTVDFLCSKTDYDGFVNANMLPSAAGLARLASEAYDKNDFVNTAYWEPQYLKNFVAKTSKKTLF